MGSGLDKDQFRQVILFIKVAMWKVNIAYMKYAHVWLLILTGHDTTVNVTYVSWGK